jgi:hypothetical protein
MRRIVIIAAALTMGVVGSIGALASVARPAPEPQRFGPPIGPDVPRDTGAGEMLLLAVGGVFPSRAEAEAANAEISFGDLQGYYVVPVAQFQGFEQGYPANAFALVSVFRTEAGAREFVQMAADFGAPAVVYPQRVRSLGGLYAGLGQEAAPDGSGPLLGPVPASLP